MNTGDVVLFVGYVVTAWVLGFCGGYLLTRFRDVLSTLG